MSTFKYFASLSILFKTSRAQNIVAALTEDFVGFAFSFVPPFLPPFSVMSLRVKGYIGRV